MLHKGVIFLYFFIRVFSVFVFYKYKKTPTNKKHDVLYLIFLIMVSAPPPPEKKILPPPMPRFHTEQDIM